MEELREAVATSLSAIDDDGTRTADRAADTQHRACERLPAAAVPGAFVIRDVLTSDECASIRRAVKALCEFDPKAALARPLPPPPPPSGGGGGDSGGGSEGDGLGGGGLVSVAAGSSASMPPLDANDGGTEGNADNGTTDGNADSGTTDGGTDGGTGGGADGDGATEWEDRRRRKSQHHTPCPVDQVRAFGAIMVVARNSGFMPLASRLQLYALSTSLLQMYTTAAPY